MSYQSQNSESKKRTTGSQFLKNDPQAGVPESREPGFRKTFAYGYDPESSRPAMSSASPQVGRGISETAGIRAESGSRYGFSTPQSSHAQLRGQTPSISAVPTRPDWLDDDDTGDTGDADNTGNTDGKTEPADTGNRVPAAPREDTSARAGYVTPEPRVPDSTSQPIHDRGTNRVHPNEEQTGTGFSKNGASSDSPPTQAADWNQTDTPATPSVTPAKPQPEPTTIANPMQLEWFVKEDDQDPWDDANAPAKDADSNTVHTPTVYTPTVHTPTVHTTSAPVTPAPRPAKMASVKNDASPAETQSIVTTTAIALNLYADRRYRAALERMQFAQWSETLLLLRAVERDYPNHPSLAGLINEAELKSGVVDQWVDKVRGRRLTVRQEAIIRRGVPIMLLLLLFVGAAGFYRAFVSPSRQAFAITQTTLRTLDEAQQLAFGGRFAEALALYDSVLAFDPGNPLARQGRREAESLYAVATEYNLAMRVAQAGNYARAAGMLENLLSRSPGFRDAEGQLASMRSQMSVQELFENAEANYRLKRWGEAVQGYETLMNMDNQFQAETVRARLQESYVQAGLVIVSQWPTDEASARLAQEYFRKAAGNRTPAAHIQAELSRLDRYFRGQQALEISDLRETINIWRSLYDEQPQYMGGYLADQLYRAYLNLANRAMQQNDTIYAMDLYQLALELEVADKTDAQRALDQLRAQAVAPTPSITTPTVQPVAYQPPVALAAALPPPQPTATPAPTPEPDRQGWIAFRTNRDGGESIYVMRPDGSEQQPASATIANSFPALIETERRSPDGLKILSVRILEGRDGPSIFVTDMGMPGGTQRDFQLTNYNRDEYDPVWSPTGDMIAFVSNHPGSDEVFTMHPDGSNVRQLTVNEWEWDKHPTFAPDGNQIAFYTNRTGPRQIFLMNRDGGGQHNISRNGHEDWDPVWIKN